MYHLTKVPTIVRRGDTFIPEGDSHAWREYQQWLAAGNTPEPAPGSDMASKISEAVLRIDAEADAITRDVVGERLAEYQKAEKEAQAFKDAGYLGTAPPSVKAWQDAKAAAGIAWTAQQAADDILATAAQWQSASNAIRAERLLRKERARAAATVAAVDAELQAWSVFVSNMRNQLGV